MSLNQDQRILSLLLLLLLVLLTICGFTIGHTSSLEPSFKSGYSSANLSQISPSVKLSRAKRVAIYNGQGVVKFVVSIAHPVKQVEKEQSFWFFYNLQSQYIPTTIPIYWWSFWNTTTFVSTARQLRKGMQATLHRDETRSWVYDAIEAGMVTLDGSERGANCLLRSICEISQLPFENSNIFSEIANAVLIPTADNVAEKYIDARDAGRAGADCQKTYKDCSQKTWKWLTNFHKLNL